MDDAYRSELFLRQFDELAGRASRGDPHDLYMAAGILRQLFLDGKPLVHQVNREHRLKLTYYIAKVPDEEPNPKRQTLLRWASLIPHSTRHETSVDRRIPMHVSEAALMGTVCVVINDCPFTVRDMIKTAAHVMGGVHAGNADDSQSLIVTTAYTSGTGGRPQIVGALQEISTIVLAGLLPLRTAIEAKLVTARAAPQEHKSDAS
jgi:hypothetical protein